MKVRAAVALLLLLSLPVPAQSRRAGDVHLRIGITPYDDPQYSTQADDTERSVIEYFNAVEDKRVEAARITVNIVHGNYYQIVQWMREGEIDGAIVTPFSAYLLMRDSPVIPAAELVRAGADSQGSQAAPAFVSGKINGTSIPSPLAALNICLQAAKESLAEPQPVQRCELRLVNHFSTTGFVIPLLYFDDFVRKQHLDTETEKAFWTRLLEWSRFELWHAAKVPERPGIPILRFSYRGPGEQLRLIELPPHLNDVLLLRRGLIPAEELEQTTKNIWLTAGDAITKLAETKPRDTWNGYVATAVWHENDRKTFADIVGGLFKAGEIGAPLAVLIQNWYSENEFTFTIDELIDLLMHDQVIRKTERAALVLPGGGVRATYQAVILDALYGRSIANVADRCDKRLIINSVVGTSGGALLGYFAARRSSIRSDALTSEWDQTKPQDVFPRFGVFRWISLLLVIGVFAVTAGVHLSLNTPPSLQVPYWYTTLLSIVIVGAPFLIWRRALRDPTYSPYWEAAGFVCVFLVAHFFHSVSVPRPDAIQGRPLIFGVVIVGVGLTYAAYLIAFPFRNRDLFDPRALSALSAIRATATSILIIAGLSMAASASGTIVARALVKAYSQALLVLMTVVALVFAFFAAGWKSGEVTTLEMTLPYWLWVFISAAFAAKLVVMIARHYHHGTLHGGIEFLASPSGTSPFPHTPTITLLAWGAISVATWLIFIAPALYSGNTGRNSFALKCLASRKRNQEALAPLLVSMTAFSSKVKGYEPYQGDYYACLQCDDVDRASRLFSMSSADHFEEAVFASGSPFPIFPAVTVHCNQTQRGLFVDGGYAHRVPIEAARLARAAQILVIENIAHRGREPGSDLHMHRVGTLWVNLANAFSFLFDRSQELDVQAQKSAVVATIYPDWTCPDPFLMDFRGPVVQWLKNEAARDLQGHRVGHIMSWGLPGPTEARR